MTRILLDIKYDSPSRVATFSKIFGKEHIYDWNHDRPEDLSGIDYIVCWQHDHGLPARMPDLKVIFSLGAGVDHILSDPELPELPIVRFVDPSLTSRMSEWIVLQTLMHLRGQRIYDDQQVDRVWREHEHPEAHEMTIGIMGIGKLGQAAAEKLKVMGFNVIGWSRTQKTLEGIECYGEAGLDEFLRKTDILIGLLPLTEATTGIYNRKLFKKLSKSGPFGAPIFINAGRGGSQVESDIIACLKDGSLYGVSLDVFENEPLAQSSDLWRFNQAIITPHAAASTSMTALAHHIETQIERFEGGQRLQYLVDRQAGY